MSLQKEHRTGSDVKETLSTLRGSITTNTVELGTNVPGLVAATERLQTNLLHEVSEFERVIGDTAGSQKLSPERLYETATADIDESPILRKINIINEYKKYLQNAIENYEDEPTRENQMALFRTIVYEFDYIKNLAINFQDAITSLKIALFSLNTEPFKREQLVALNIVMDMIKQNINIPDDILSKIVDELDTHFNLAYPLEGINLIE